MLDPRTKSTQQVSPNELEFLQGIFDRVCMLRGLRRPSAQADHLARFIMDEFRAGVVEEAALVECALWWQARQSPTRPHNDEIKYHLGN